MGDEGSEMSNILSNENKKSNNEIVDENVIKGDASTFDRKNDKKSKLTGKERTRALSFSDIIVDAFFDKKKKEQKDTSIETKVSGNTPAAEARKPVSEKSTKMPKKGGILGKLKGVGGAVGGIVAAAAALALLVGVGPIPGVLPNLAKIDWSMIGKAFIILGSLALVGKLMGKGGKGMLYMAGALAILVGVGPIPGVLENMSNIDWGMIGKAFVILGGLAVVGKLMKKGSYGILAAAAALAILAGIGPIPGALENLANIEWATIGKAFIILGSIAIAGNLMKSGAVGLLLGAVALTLLVHGALIPLQDIEWSTIGKGIVAILALGAVGALLGLISAPLALGAGALLLLGLALLPIVYSLKQFQEIDWDRVGGAFKGLLILGVVGAILGVVSPLLILAGFALGAFGLGLIPLAIGMALIVPGFEAFMPMIEKLSKINAGNLLLLGPAMIGLAAGLLALVAGETIGKVLDGLGSLFGGEGPLDKLIKLGEVAEPILKLKDGLDSLGEIDLDDLKISGEPDVAVEGIRMITGAVYGLIMAQQESVKLFKQMYSGPPTSIFDKLFGVTEKVKSKKDVKNCCCDYKEGSKDSEDNQSKSSGPRSFIDEIKFKISKSRAKAGLPPSSVSGTSGYTDAQLKEHGLSRPKEIKKTPPSSKKDPLKRLTTIMETMRVQLDTLTTYGRLTEDNTSKTVDAIKRMKVDNSNVVAPGGDGSQQASVSPETLLNSRSDYSASPYSLGVPSAV
jgi:hypothetical protein